MKKDFKVLKNAVLILALITVLVMSVCAAEETKISIYRDHAEDGVPFYMPNMFPGDSQTGTYTVQVSHKGKITVHFGTFIRDGGEKLAEVLKCTVKIKGADKELYDGLMRDMPQKLDYTIDSSRAKTTKITYLITVYLDTSVGNDYMNKNLVADFRWWVDDEDDDDYPVDPNDPYFPIHPDHPDIPDHPEFPEGGEPELPDKPDKPDKPDVPDVPDKPDRPDDPDNPDYPDNPDNPDNPDSPDVPDHPDGTEPDDPDSGTDDGNDDDGKDDGDGNNTDGENDEKDSDKPAGELVYPPQTGDAHFCMWFYIAMISLFLNILLLFPAKRRRNG